MKYFKVRQNKLIHIDGNNEMLYKGNMYPENGILVKKYPELFEEINGGELLTEMPEKPLKTSITKEEKPKTRTKKTETETKTKKKETKSEKTK